MTSDLLLNEKVAPLETVWQTVKEHLKRKKSQISEEIFHYPPPIPACDVQFNYLLEQRARLVQTLRQLDTLSQAPLSSQERLQRMREFIFSSPELDETTIQEICSLLQATQDEPEPC